jgi:hypothetical protein
MTENNEGSGPTGHPPTPLLTEFIRSGLVIGRRIFQDADFRADAMATWFEKYGHRDRMEPFNCSAGYISNFKKRHLFTS